ncbi:MAG: hypothetical protein M3Z50_08775 [Actinomycetota bacterium]|nr:hypothetical protein [Actinomycetota bacterium]
MNTNSPHPLSPCPSSPCQSYNRGHQIHFIQARHVGESPWGWRDATITDIDEGKVLLAYVHEDGNPVVWHHRPLSGVLSAGEVVRLHEGLRVLGTPSGWFCVAIEHGLGAVPEPDEPALWAAETSLGIVDLSTGNAVGTDHQREQPDEQRERVSPLRSTRPVRHARGR